MNRRLLVAFAIVSLAGCDACGSTVMGCEESPDCLQGGIPGVCMPSPSGAMSSWCAFPDTTCPGGYRWGILSGEGIASACLAAGPPDAGVPDAAPSSRYFVLDQDDHLLVYDPATILPLGGGALLTPPEAFNAHVSQVGADLFVTRGAGAAQWTTALDPLTLQPRAGSPRTAPSLCNVESVEVAGLYCTYDDGEHGEVQLRKLSDYSMLRTFQLPRPVSMEVVDDHMLMLSNNEAIYVLDAQLTQLGAPIPGVNTLARTLSVSLDRIAVAFYIPETEASTVRLYSLATHAQIGAEKVFVGHGDISGVVFDKEKLIVTFKAGHVMALAVDGTGTEIVPLVTRAGNRFDHPTFDATRNRIVGIDVAGTGHIIVLDAATLQHVSGSPATLPKSGVSLLVF
jgi:hypothetical protein